MKKLLLFSLFIISVNFSFAQSESSAKSLSIMVMPSDNLLYQLNCLDSVDNQGQTIMIRNFERAFIQNTSLKSAITAIGNQFNALGLELVTLEQSLKDLQTRGARNNANRVKLDPLTALLRTASPDLILELSYEYKEDAFGNSLTFILDAIDAYSSKSVASISHPGLKGAESDIATLLKDQIEKNSTGFLNDLSDYAVRMEENGREVSLYLQVGEDSEVNLQRDKCGTQRIGDVIQGWMRVNTFKGRFKRDYQSEYELSFSDVRIPKLNEYGQGIQVNDWLIGLAEELKKTCNLDPLDVSRGLGDGVLIFE